MNVSKATCSFCGIVIRKGAIPQHEFHCKIIFPRLAEFEELNKQGVSFSDMARMTDLKYTSVKKRAANIRQRLPARRKFTHKIPDKKKIVAPVSCPHCGLEYPRGNIERHIELCKVFHPHATKAAKLFKCDNYSFNAVAKTIWGSDVNSKRGQFVKRQLHRLGLISKSDLSTPAPRVRFVSSIGKEKRVLSKPAIEDHCPICGIIYGEGNNRKKSISSCVDCELRGVTAKIKEVQVKANNAFVKEYRWFMNLSDERYNEYMDSLKGV